MSGRLAAGGVGPAESPRDPPSARGGLVLVVDDDARLRRFVGDTLDLAGFDVCLAGDGEAVAGLVAERRPDLVVLDLVLPGLSGLEVLRRLRATRRTLPVIMLTARDDEDDKVQALQDGADDYLVKPFSARELVARAHAVLRRSQGTLLEDGETQVLRVGPLQLEPGSRTARLGERRIDLTRTEYTLLLTLLRGAGRVFTPADLLTRVWGPEYRDQGEILRTNVYRLRQKLEDDPRRPRFLRTRLGVGYYFSASPTPEGDG